MKPTTQILLLMIAVTTIGIALPTTFSLGSGQHQFVQINPTNANEFCQKCHMQGDSISAELLASGNGLYNGGGRIHAGVSCVECHQVTNAFNNGNPKVEHAAKIPTCIKCHTSGGLGDVMGDVVQELDAPTEAHQNFNDDTACVGCHTTSTVTGSISYTYSKGKTYNGLTVGSRAGIPVHSS